MGYLFTFIKQGDPYLANWEDMRRRFLIFWVCFFAWMPVTISLATFIVWLGVSESNSIFWVGIPTMLLLTATRIYAVNWPCPRCGKAYFRAPFVLWTLADYCLHCGLPKYAPNNERTEHNPRFPQADADRYTLASIRVRVIDPRFEGLSIEKRASLVERFLNQLLEETQQDVVRLFAPSEIILRKKPTRQFMMNMEFEEPSPSML